MATAQRVLKDVKTGKVVTSSYEYAPEITPITPLEIRMEASRRLEALASPYSAQERATWPSQVAEAEAVLAGSRASSPMLESLGAARAKDLRAMAERVISKRDMFNVASANVLAAQERILAMNPIPQDYQENKYW